MIDQFLASLLGLPSGLAPLSEREVAKFPEGYDWVVSTVASPDGEHSYETAIKSEHYNDHDIMIVEEYDTLEQAKEGHERWVKVMTADVLPEQLTEVSTSPLAIGLDAQEGRDWRIHKAKTTTKPAGFEPVE